MPIWQTWGRRANSSSRFANFINRSTVIDDWLTSWLSDGSSWRICTSGSRSTVKDKSYTWKTCQKITGRMETNIYVSTFLSSYHWTLYFIHLQTHTRPSTIVDKLLSILYYRLRLSLEICPNSTFQWVTFQTRPLINCFGGLDSTSLVHLWEPRVSPLHQHVSSFTFIVFVLCCTSCTILIIIIITRGQSNLTKSASRGAHSPVRGHPGGRKLYHWIPGAGFPISVP